MFIAIVENPARVVYKYRILIQVKVNPVLYVLFLTERLKTNFDNPFFFYFIDKRSEPFAR